MPCRITGLLPLWTSQCRELATNLLSNEEVRVEVRDEEAFGNERMPEPDPSDSGIDLAPG